MAVVGSAVERPDSPEADISLGKRTYTRRFLVRTNDRNDGPLVAVGASGLPALYTIYATANESDPFARLRSYNARPESPGSLDWIAECRYETPDPKDGSTGTSSGGSGGNAGGGTGSETPGEYENPIIELPEVRCSSMGEQKPITETYNGESNTVGPVTNSADEVFDPPPNRDVGYLELVITRNEIIDGRHPGLILKYLNTVNSDVFFGLPAGTWKVAGIVPERQTRQIKGGTTVVFLRVTYTLHGRESWDLKLLNHGTYYYDGITGKTRFMTADAGSTTGLLDDIGQRLYPNPITGVRTPTYKTIRPYKWVPFAPLGLPQSFNDVR